MTPVVMSTEMMSDGCPVDRTQNSSLSLEMALSYVCMSRESGPHPSFPTTSKPVWQEHWVCVGGGGSQEQQ